MPYNIAGLTIDLYILPFTLNGTLLLHSNHCQIIQCIEILKSCLNLNIDKVIAYIKILKKHRASGDATQEIMICMLHGYAI